MTSDGIRFESNSKSKGPNALSKILHKKHRKPSAAKRSEFRERSNLMLSTASLGVGVASLVLALNEKGVDRPDRCAGSVPRVLEDGMTMSSASHNAPPKLKHLTPQDIESSCRGRNVTWIVLKASGGNIGTFRYRPGSGDEIVSQFGRMDYWKKQRVGDTLYYFVGH